jgi:Uma2 family endonuclease
MGAPSFLRAARAEASRQLSAQFPGTLKSHNADCLDLTSQEGPCPMSTLKVQIGPADHGRAMTLEDFREADEEPGYFYELARGMLEVGEVPGDQHGQIVDNLHEAFSHFRARHPGLVRRIAHGSDLRVLIPQLESDRHPDLALVFFEAPLDQRGRQIPALLCEVVSPGTRARRRDYDEKSDEYLAVGIQEYWIIDPEHERVTIRTFLQGAAGTPTPSERIFTGDQTIASELLPGFQCRVSQLWIDPETGGEKATGNGS